MHCVSFGILLDLNAINNYLRRSLFEFCAVIAVFFLRSHWVMINSINCCSLFFFPTLPFCMSTTDLMVSLLAVSVWFFNSWCQLFHQNHLNNVVVFVLQGMSQLHFYRFYLEFGFLRKAFRHVSIRAWVESSHPETNARLKLCSLAIWLNKQ